MGVKFGAWSGCSLWAAAFCLQISISSASCEILPCVSAALARTKCVSAFWAHSGTRHFSCKFPYQVALVKCRSAFRLRRLAQSVCLRSGLGSFWGAEFSCKFWLKVALVKCRSAFRPRTSVGPASGARYFSYKFPLKMALVKCQCISTAQARTKCGPSSGPIMIVLTLILILIIIKIIIIIK